MYYDERENNLNYNTSNIKELDITNSYEENYNEFNSKLNDTDININNININNFRKEHSKDLYSLEEGLNKGNSFKDEYIPYKNYVYRVVVKGDKDELLLRVQELTFRVIDLNLYLDIMPSSSLYNEFRRTLRELNNTKALYEKKYGPLCLTDSGEYDKYMWSSNPWPWMNEGGKY